MRNKQSCITYVLNSRFFFFFLALSSVLKLDSGNINKDLDTFISLVDQRLESLLLDLVHSDRARDHGSRVEFSCFQIIHAFSQWMLFSRALDAKVKL